MPFRATPAAGFTLIELLTVITIMAILASITISVARGVYERSNIAKARAEMAVIAAALEQYKLQYGDYPQVDPSGGATPSANLVQALIGLRGPTGTVFATPRKSFIDVSRFRFHTPSAGDVDPYSNASAEFTDPWGKHYCYTYRTVGALSSDWSNPTFILYSLGPDLDGYLVEDNGFPHLPDEYGADNVYPPGQEPLPPIKQSASKGATGGSQVKTQSLKDW